MNDTRLRIALAVALVAFAHVASAQDDDDDRPPPAGEATPTLNAEQREAVGIVVAQPTRMKAPEHVPAFAEVLDPSALIADIGAADASRAAERAARAEAARLEGLYKAGAGASRKNLEAAEAEQARAHADLVAAETRIALRWSPLDALPAAARRAWIDGAASGARRLVRIDLPGRRSIAVEPKRATLDVDGVAVEAKILGVLGASSADVQSASLLAGLEHAPSGLGPGARVAATLDVGDKTGFLVPRGALIYEEGGTFVYHELAAKPGDTTRQYARKPVTLIAASGDGWLVDGLDDDDQVVVRGAGVLWSLEGVGSMPMDDDD